MELLEALPQAAYQMAEASFLSFSMYLFIGLWWLVAGGFWISLSLWCFLGDVQEIFGYLETGASLVFKPVLLFFSTFLLIFV